MDKQEEIEKRNLIVRAIDMAIEKGMYITDFNISKGIRTVEEPGRKTFDETTVRHEYDGTMSVRVSFGEVRDNED